MGSDDEEVGITSQKALHEQLFGDSASTATTTRHPLVAELSTCVLDINLYRLPLTPSPTPTFSKECSAVRLGALEPSLRDIVDVVIFVFSALIDVEDSVCLHCRFRLVFSKAPT